MIASALNWKLSGLSLLVPISYINTREKNEKFWLMSLTIYKREKIRIFPFYKNDFALLNLATCIRYSRLK